MSDDGPVFSMLTGKPCSGTGGYEVQDLGCPCRCYLKVGYYTAAGLYYDGENNNQLRFWPAGAYQTFLDTGDMPNGTTRPHGALASASCPSGSSFDYGSDGPPQASCPPNANACAYYVCSAYIVDCDCSIADVGGAGSSLISVSPTPSYYITEPMFGACNGVYGMQCGVCIEGECDYASI